ncbi:MAG: ribonuclease H-like domain-containing protein [Treponema sp.]|jgi:uncharacterized protein YprB with RNaseH-like and TPR domain|nr:ribonuclease H-like domain-containing protein [Treponema sp.]
MAANLRDRLRRIQENKKNENSVPESVREERKILVMDGWNPCGYLTTKREVSVALPFDVQSSLPPALAILVPDCRKLPAPSDFLFFDLETTGLSGGAGTVAFLAAFGRPVKGKLLITQYLLLDYPGESDFIEAVLGEFKNEESVIVTYNGKCFDSQILKTRCLMNGVQPPEYLHADLLHPARRLWKNVVGDCSQGSIETRILGLDRSGDTPGALAPEIWFEFLRTGATERLIGICDHNCADISGLASILAAMISIAADPFVAGIRYDPERLALYWRNFSVLEKDVFPAPVFDELKEKGERLLRLAAENCPRAAFVYALDQLRCGNFEEGRKRLLAISKSDFPDAIKAAALRSLAIDSEKRRDIAEALDFTKRGLKLLSENISLKLEFEKRMQRLEKKLTYP